VTYGGGRIPEEQLFVRIVARLAEREGATVEVVNISAPAWSPQNWLAYINNNGLYDGDIVVLVLPECDLARPFMTMGPAGHRSESLPLRLGNILFKALAILKEKVASSETHLGVISEDLGQVAALNVYAVKQLRQKVGETPFLAVFIPSGLPSSGKFWALFEKELPQALDLRSVLIDEQFFLDGVHLSAKGHLLVGERIFSRLRSVLK
jgi:hypothetical protein